MTAAMTTRMSRKPLKRSHQRQAQRLQMYRMSLLLLLLLFSGWKAAEAFQSRHVHISTTRNQHTRKAPGSLLLPTLPATRTFSTAVSPLQLSANKKKTSDYKQVDDGRSVGFVLLAISLGFAVWLFTIPPTFRRAYLCPSDYFVNESTEVRECTTLREWFAGVSDYYDKGGGIQWDFSIDPETVQKNEEFLDAVFGTSKNEETIETTTRM